MLFSLLWLLAEGEQSQATPQQGSPFGGIMIPMLLIMVVWFYFLMIRPQRAQEKQRQALVAALKKNDRVVNSGGIIGVVDSIKEKEDEVVLKGGIRILKSSIQRVIPPDEPAKES
jgi:preprotein translocase subunit YajC